MGLLRTPISVGNKAVRGLMDMSTSARMQRAEDMGFDTNTNWYHGTNDLENIAKTGFDPSFTGKGNDQFGSGFYFSTRPSQASSFATNLNRNKAGEVQPAGIIKANLALKNPLVVDGTKVSNINELPIDLSSDDVRELLEYSTALKRGLDDEQMNPMGDQFSEFWDDGPTDEMMDKLVDTYTNSNLSAIEGDLFDGNATAFREGLAKVTGYDGIVIDFGDGFKNAVAWKPEQVRSTSAKFDPRKANRGDLIASNPVATTSAGLMANMTGQPSNLASYMQGNTDAYLTAQERAYLNNRQEFDDFFSDDTGYVRADVLPFRTNENTGDSEFATPQMIKGLLSSLYDLGQSPRSGIYNQQSILDLI